MKYALDSVVNILRYVASELEDFSGRSSEALQRSGRAERLHLLLPTAGFREVQFLQTLFEAGGEVVSDQELCRRLSLRQSSLKIYASGARRALEKAGFSSVIHRKRGDGYYLITNDISDHLDILN